MLIHACFVRLYYLFISTEKEARKKSAFFAVYFRTGVDNTAYQAGDRQRYLNAYVNPGGYYSVSTG